VVLGLLELELEGFRDLSLSFLSFFPIVSGRDQEAQKKSIYAK